MACFTCNDISDPFQRTVYVQARPGMNTPIQLDCIRPSQLDSLACFEYQKIGKKLGPWPLIYRLKWNLGKSSGKVILRFTPALVGKIILIPLLALTYRYAKNCSNFVWRGSICLFIWVLEHDDYLGHYVPIMQSRNRSWFAELDVLSELGPHNILLVRAFMAWDRRRRVEKA